MDSNKKIIISPMRGQALLNFIDRNVQEDYILNIYDSNTIEKVNNSHKSVVNDGNILTDGLVFYGDCLSTCAYLIDNNIKIDLVYIDPPFASNANYGAKLKLKKSDKQFLENDVADSSIGEELMYGDTFSKESYLNWIYIRLLAIKECMSDDASIFVHLDNTIGHYVKIILDEIFGENNFVNEIVWHYTSSRSPKDRLARKHDTIFYYSKSGKRVFNMPYKPLSESSKEKYNMTEKDGRRYKMVNGYKKYMKDEIPEDDTWHIPLENVMSKENTGYSTQKPKELIKRILEMASNEGMLVADYFGGSGVTAKVAKDLKRKFITCDIGKNAINKIRDGLKDRGAAFDIIDIKDGLDLFKNSSQIKKLFRLINDATPLNGYNGSDLWTGMIPLSISKKDVNALVHFVDNTTLLNRQYLELNLERITRESLNCDIKDYIIVYIFKDDYVTQQRINDFLSEKGIDITVTLKSVEELISGRKHSFYSKNTASIIIEDGFIKIKSFASPYLFNMIKKAKKEKELSLQGFELIENIQFCFRNDDVWVADVELIHNDNGTWSCGSDSEVIVRDDFIGIKSSTDKCKVKIRDISGEDLIVCYSSFEKEDI